MYLCRSSLLDFLLIFQQVLCKQQETGRNLQSGCICLWTVMAPAQAWMPPPLTNPTRASEKLQDTCGALGCKQNLSSSQTWEFCQVENYLLTNFRGHQRWCCRPKECPLSFQIASSGAWRRTLGLVGPWSFQHSLLWGNFVLEEDSIMESKHRED